MKILFLTSHFCQERDANGVCVYNVSQSFLKMSHSIYVIESSYSDSFTPKDIDGIKVYGVKEGLFKIAQRSFNKKKRNKYEELLFRVFHFLRNCVALPFFPKNNPFRIKKIQKLATRLVKDEGIDIVVATYMPYDALAAGKKMKQKDPSLTVFAYHLDVLGESHNSNSFIRGFKRRRLRRFFSKEIRVFDRVFLPMSESNEGYVDNNKIKCLEFPMYIKPNDFINIEGLPFDDEHIDISYVGSLDSDNRNPKELFKLIERINEERGDAIRVHIWGKIEDQAIVSIINSFKFVTHHGYIGTEMIPSLLSKSDFLLNMANKNSSKMIPSKIFLLFAAGKPIIDWVQSSDDVSIEYFTRSKNSLLLFSWKNSNLKEQLEHFLFSKNIIESNDLAFYDCTPDYVASRLVEN